MRLITYTLRRMLSNKPLLGWGIFLSLFWVIAGSFFEAKNALRNVPQGYLAQAYWFYSSAYFMYAIIASLSAVAVSTSLMLTFHTGSLPYLFRYGKLRPKTYMASVYVGLVFVSLIIGSLMTLATSVLFSINGMGVDVYPKEPLLTVGSIFMTSLFMTSFSFFLVLLLVKYLGLKNQNFVSLIPVILAFFTFFSYVNLDYNNPWINYVSPFTSLMLVSGYSFLGSPLPISYGSIMTAFGNHMSFQHPYLGLLVISALMWTAILFLADVILLDRVTLERVEEAKLV